MNVEIGNEAAHAQFPEKEYINGIFIAVPVFLYNEEYLHKYFY